MSIRRCDIDLIYQALEEALGQNNVPVPASSQITGVGNYYTVESIRGFTIANPTTGVYEQIYYVLVNRTLVDGTTVANPFVPVLITFLPFSTPGFTTSVITGSAAATNTAGVSAISTLAAANAAILPSVVMPWGQG